MSDETQPQNPIPEENPSPVSPQEPTEPAPLNTRVSEPAEVPSEAPESSPSDFEVKSTDIPPSDSNPAEAEIPLEPTGLQADPVSNGTGQPENVKAQTSTNEPLNETGAKPVEIEIAEPEPLQQTEAKPPSVSSSTLPRSSNKNMSELLAKEHLAIQNRKRKKLDLILTLFAKQTKITNDEVEKFLHVSDATATRYLTQLENEGKIKKNEQGGKKGKWVSYLKM